MEAELERLSKNNDEEKLKNEELRAKLHASSIALQQEKQMVRPIDLLRLSVPTSLFSVRNETRNWRSNASRPTCTTARL